MGTYSWARIPCNTKPAPCFNPNHCVSPEILDSACWLGIGLPSCRGWLSGVQCLTLGAGVSSWHLDVPLQAPWADGIPHPLKRCKEAIGNGMGWWEGAREDNLNPLWATATATLWAPKHLCFICCIQCRIKLCSTSSALLFFFFPSIIQGSDKISLYRS